MLYALQGQGSVHVPGTGRNQNRNQARVLALGIHVMARKGVETRLRGRLGARAHLASAASGTSPSQPSAFPRLLPRFSSYSCRLSFGTLIDTARLSRIISGSSRMALESCDSLLVCKGIIKMVRVIALDQPYPHHSLHTARNLELPSPNFCARSMQNINLD